ncbi:MAG: phenylalanine--tRNA ligase subunit alpha [Ruminococcaceae bacterium]|nr:phenylalanine--tRNA ligase subunit alpha [Oscillospiraceae bacterium]MBR5552862.1 phenylalanine--tRNA ligase subunit alpha [Clostridia bacterium]
MKEKLQALRAKALDELSAITSSDDLSKALEEFKVKYLGKKSELVAVMKGMGALSPEERPIMGQLANEVRGDIEAAFSEAREKAQKADLERKLIEETIDVTLPGKSSPMGRPHPISAVQTEIENIFIGLGFEIVDGPEVEYDYYNFTALNIPPDHPARDTQDTFYINSNVLLRTQTSSVQIHAMEKKRPPIRMISPGRVYRSDAIDATHSPMFHQIEGLVVDKGITMGDLKGTLELFSQNLFGEDTKIRFRPHHFPFTEPSAEVDVSCFACGGKGCRLCKGEGWIEILGAGMVHPDVLRRCDIDPDEYSGFAFGLGIERVVMKKYNIDDLRLLYENDVRFLSQF